MTDGLRLILFLSCGLTAKPIEIRDISLFNGFNKIFQRIEFNCGLAYGTLSDLSTVEKTAEELKTSKQRSFSTVSAIQKSFESSLEHIVYIYNFYAT